MAALPSTQFRNSKGELETTDKRRQKIEMGCTLRSIDFDILVERIFLLNKRFAHGMSTELEQSGMSTDLMTIRFQRHGLMTIPFLSFVATFRFISTFIETCKSRRRAYFFANRRRRCFIWASYC